MSQESRCPNCGSMVASTKTFCGKCGARLLAIPPTISDTPVSAETPASLPPSAGGGTSDTLLRGSGLLMGIVLLVVALLFCGCWALLLAFYIPPPVEGDVVGDRTADYVVNYLVPFIMCGCLPGTLLAIAGVVLTLSPFGGRKGWIMSLRSRREITSKFGADTKPGEAEAIRSPDLITTPPAVHSGTKPGKTEVALSHFLRGSGVLVGFALLLMALLFCSVGGSVGLFWQFFAAGETPDMTLAGRGVLCMIPLLVCGLPGALLAITGVLVALYPFALERGK